MANLGKVSNTNTNGGPGGGLGSNCLAKETRFVDERPTFWLNPHEASSRRGQARDSGDRQSRGRGLNEVSGR